MSLNKDVSLDGQALDLVRNLDPCKLFYALELIIRYRYMRKVVEMLDTLERCEVIMAQKELFDIAILLLQHGI